MPFHRSVWLEMACVMELLRELPYWMKSTMRECRKAECSLLNVSTGVVWRQSFGFLIEMLENIFRACFVWGLIKIGDIFEKYELIIKIEVSILILNDIFMKTFQTQQLKWWKKWEIFDFTPLISLFFLSKMGISWN